MLTLVFLHGYGSDGAHMKRALGTNLNGRTVRSIFLDAPQPCDLFRGRRQWFRLSYLPDYLAPQIERQAHAVVEQLQPLSETTRRWMLVGHSQGAMVAAYVALAGWLPACSSICISAMLPFLHRLRPQPTPGGELTFLHGAQDRMAPAPDICRAVAQLQAAGVCCRLRCLEGAGHELNEDLSSFARREIEHQATELQNDDHLRCTHEHP